MLALRPIVNHSGKMQCDALFSVSKNYGIVQKLGSIVADNVSTNDTLCQKVEECLFKDNLEWNSIYHRLRCAGHIINLTV